MKVHYVIYFALLANILVAAVAIFYFEPYHIRILWYLAFGLVTLSGLLAIFWLYQQAIFNVEKQFGDTNKFLGLTEITVYVICLAVILTPALTFASSYAIKMNIDLDRFDSPGALFEHIYTELRLDSRSSEEKLLQSAEDISYGLRADILDYEWGGDIEKLEGLFLTVLGAINVALMLFIFRNVDFLDFIFFLIYVVVVGIALGVLGSLLSERDWFRVLSEDHQHLLIMVIIAIPALVALSQVNRMSQLETYSRFATINVAALPLAISALIVSVLAIYVGPDWDGAPAALSIALTPILVFLMLSPMLKGWFIKLMSLPRE